MAYISMVADTLAEEKSQPDILEYVPKFYFQFFSVQKHQTPKVPSSVGLIGIALAFVAVLVSLQSR